jgi:hypothetical protein
MAERVKIIRSAAPALIKEFEALVKPLLAAIAIARRLPGIELPTDDDGRIGAGIYKMVNGFHKEFRGPIVSTEHFVGALSKLEKSMQEIAARVPWHRRGLDG